MKARNGATNQSRLRGRRSLVVFSLGLVLGVAGTLAVLSQVTGSSDALVATESAPQDTAAVDAVALTAPVNTPAVEKGTPSRVEGPLEPEIETTEADEVAGSAVCTFTNPNDPNDDPNPPLDSAGYGRDDVSSNPVPAGYPTPLTTGLCGVGLTPADLTPSGTMTVTVDGTVIDGMDVDGQINVQANNVTIRNTRVTTDGWHAIKLESGYNNLTIEDTRVRGIGAEMTVIQIFGTATLRRVHATGGKIVLRGTRGFVLEDSYLTGGVRKPESHNDPIQVRQGSGYRILHNTIIGFWKSGTAAMGFQAKDPSGGEISDLVIDGNYLSGGGYVIYTTDIHYPITNAVIQNNRIEADSWRFGESPFYNPADVPTINNVILPAS